MFDDPFVNYLVKAILNGIGVGAILVVAFVIYVMTFHNPGWFV